MAPLVVIITSFGPLVSSECFIYQRWILSLLFFATALAAAAAATAGFSSRICGPTRTGRAEAARLVQESYVSFMAFDFNSGRWRQL